MSKATEKISKIDSWLFEKIHGIDKILIKWPRKKEKKYKLPQLGMKQETFWTLQKLKGLKKTLKNLTSTIWQLIWNRQICRQKWSK